MPTVLNPAYTVRIGAVVEKKAGFRNFELRKHGNVVGRDRVINFRIAKINVPPPYDIYWKVRNTGGGSNQRELHPRTSRQGRRHDAAKGTHEIPWPALR